MPASSTIAADPNFASERLQFITHRGKRVLFVNLAQCDAAGLKSIAEESYRVISREPLNSVLTLNDVTGTAFDPVSVEAMKSKLQANAPYVKRSAVIGISGLQSLIYEAVKFFTKRNIPLFATREEALDWLVQE